KDAAISPEDQSARDDVVFPDRRAETIAVASVIAIGLHAKVVGPKKFAVAHVKRVDRDLARRTKHNVVDDRRRAQATLTRARVHAFGDAVWFIDLRRVEIFFRITIVHGP